MIIKSMSRKSKSFSQLYNYLCREEYSDIFSRNIYADAHNKQATLDEFYNNAKYLKNSRGKLYMYHEVISLEKNNLSSERQKEILLDIADKYLYQRADQHLAFGVLHNDKDNIHVHLMISANEIEGQQRIRLSKKEFSAIQQRLENYKNQKYKELEKTEIYKEQKDLSKSKQKEQELKRRGARSIKQEIQENLRDVFKKASSLSYLEKHLKSLNYELYTRGKTQGVSFDGKNYRLKTLGLEQEYKAMMKKLERIKEREIRRERFKEDREYTRER